MIVEIFSEHKIPSTTWNGSVSTDWFNANNWSSGVPNVNKIAIIAPATNACLLNTSSGSAYSVKVLNGGNLTINSELIVINAFVNLGTSASVIFDINGTLTQTGTSFQNIGSISFNRSTYIVLNDFTYWSGPLNGQQTLQGFSPNSNLKYFETYDNGWAYVNATKTTWSPTIGVAILAPKSISSTIPSNNTFQFVGVPNNGTYLASVTLPTGVTNPSFVKFIGNPYPTKLNLDKFIVTNSSKISYLSFWPHYHGPTGTSYDSNSYVHYTLLGSTSVDEFDVTKQIKWADAGVGFVATGIQSGTLTFNNDMKINDNFNFNRHRLWLNFTKINDSSFSQTLMGYTQTSGNIYNIGYDVTGNTNSFQIFSFKSGVPFNIQSKPIPFQNTDIFNLGYTTTLSGTHKISYVSSDGVLGGSQAIYLNDNVLSAKTNLKLSAYTFNAISGTVNNRFFISFI